MRFILIKTIKKDAIGNQDEKLSHIQKDYPLFIIQCEYQAPNNEMVGYRGEGTNQQIKLITNQVRFSYVPNKIHPDLIALICVIIFYPFFQPGETISFPEKISFLLATELEKLPIYGMLHTDKGLKYKKTNSNIFVSSDNIDKTLLPYQGKGASVISFGGGLDSLALLGLFPNLTIIHEAPDDKMTDSTSGEKCNQDSIGIVKLIQQVKALCRNKNYTIFTNSKTLTEPIGWTTWISCIATSLLLANDLGTTNIVLGSSMGSLLKSCAKFRQNGLEFPQNSIWANLLEKSAHIKLVTPILGLSELSLIKLVDHRLLNYAIWCDKDKNTLGQPCKQCAKCFRRYLLLADFLDDVKNVHWDNYNNLAVHKLLRDLHLAGPTLSYLLRKHQKNLPYWITRYLSLLSNDVDISYVSEQQSGKADLRVDGALEVDLFSWYHRSLAYIPESLRNYIT